MENYGPLPNDPNKINYDIVNKTITKFQKKHLTNNKVADGVKAQHARTPRFYKKSKIYKGRIPGKPVISSVNCQS